VNPDGRSDPQDEYDKLYRVLLELMDTYYPERTITITSSDPPYVTPAVKYMLRRKNQLMRSGRDAEAAALATKIGDAIKKFTSAELCRVTSLRRPSTLFSQPTS
jgi:hypothetical protein